ncbi:CoA transferase [Marinobacterium maritimum]|uniref:CoA transferase n=1 Tax=Marinobacterium maritimum TaxID=500162 RepID=A0ABN1I5U9_9GAMM
MPSLLEGIKVVELASYAAGPSAGVILSDFGADVIKIEPLTGDPWRYGHLIPPLPSSDIAYCNLIQNRNKKSVALDMKKAEAQQVFYKLVESADVLLSNCLPSVAEDLNVQYEKIKAINPRIIYAQINGYGEGGDEDNAPGYDGTGWYARSGLMETLRAKDGDPVPIPLGMGDMSTATALFASIMAGLYRRETTGEGSKVTTSLIENGVWSNAISIQSELIGAGSLPKFAREDWPQPTVNAIYKTKDGRHIIIIQLNDRVLNDMYEVIGANHLIGDERFKDHVNRYKNHKALFNDIQAAIIKMNLDEVVEALTSVRVTFSIVKQTRELPNDPQANAIGLWPEVEGMAGVRTVNSPINVSGAEKVKPRPAPELVGSDTAAELKLIGYSDEEIQRLAAAQVIGVAGLS